MDESEGKTKAKYFGNLVSGLKKRICLKSDDGISEAKKYLKEAMATRGAEAPIRRGSLRKVSIEHSLNLEDE